MGEGRPVLPEAGQVLRAALGRLGQIGTPVSRTEALHVRDALMLAFLLLHPLRARNICGLQLGRTLRHIGAGWHLSIPAAEEKCGRAIDCPVDPVISGWLDRYLASVRPVVAGPVDRSDGHLWPSLRGTPISIDSFAFGIARASFDLTGHRLTPHMARHLAATAFARHAPGEMGLSAALLGHRNGVMADRHYNLAGSREAGRSHARLISGLLDHSEDP